MKAERQTLEQALAEVLAIRQRLDAVSDQLRITLSALRAEETITERAKIAAEERRKAEQEATAQQDATRAALLRGLAELFAPFAQHLARQQRTAKPSRQKVAKPRQPIPAMKATTRGQA